MERKNVWKTYSEEQLKAADVFGKEYMYFLDHGKTEREGKGVFPHCKPMHSLCLL